MLGAGPLGSTPLGAASADALLLDTLVVTDAIAGVMAAAPLVDQVTVSDPLGGRLAITSTLVDTVVARDAASGGLTATVSDTLLFGDALASYLGAALGDAVIVSEQLSGTLAVSAMSSDTVMASDLPGSCLIAIAEDAVVVSDALAGAIAVASPVLADTLLIGETLAGALACYAPVLVDALGAADEMTGRLALVGVLSDTVLAGDALADAAFQVIVVTNAETGAASTYTLTPTVAGLAEVRGTLYLAGPDGLYALDAGEDEDGAVSWTLRTGFSTLGTDQFKRIRDVNVLARTDGETTLHVVADRLGEKQTWSYLQAPLARDAYRDGVIPVGKGIHSVYYQFALTGTGPAEIDQLRLTVEPLSRRR